MTNTSARSYAIRESGRRILNPFSDEKFATLGRALRLPPGTRLLDLASGKGEVLCTWARDHGFTGTGVDQSSFFLDDARVRAAELDVSDRVEFVQTNAGTYVCEEPVDVACCVGASWIAGGVAGTVELLRSSLRPGGMMLLGEPYWRRQPESPEVLAACHAPDANSYRSLPGLVEQFAALGIDLVEMVLADQDNGDRYVTAQWLSIRRWLDANPDDELAPDVRQELVESPIQHVRYRREIHALGRLRTHGAVTPSPRAIRPADRARRCRELGSGSVLGVEAARWLPQTVGANDAEVPATQALPGWPGGAAGLCADERVDGR
jgi:SAM-dependent methyltransferase